MLIEIGIILLLIVLNGIFSMSEIAIVSSRKSRLESAAQKGDGRAGMALELTNSPNKFLSTVQVGITSIGVLNGVFGGANLADHLSIWLARIPIIQPYSHAIALSIIVILITFFSLVIGELVPKRIGMHSPESIARVMAYPMNFISKLCSPLVWLLSHSTEWILKLFRLKASVEPPVTEEEIKSLMAQGTNMGMFEEVEQDIVERVFQLSDRKVGSIMTHKLDVEWIDINDDMDLIKNEIIQSAYSSFPVCRETIDDVIGIIYTKKFLQLILQNGQVDLQTAVEKPLFVPESMKAFRVLEQFKTSGIRIAIVVDEFGTVQGIVTLKDLFEALVGDLDSVTEEESEIVEREDGTFLVDALIPFEDFIQYFELADIDPEDRGGFHTLGGLIFNIARQIPKTGERFQWNNVEFEIIDMDGNRIDKVLVTMREEEEKED
jgi:putative hemolysin